MSSDPKKIVNLDRPHDADPARAHGPAAEPRRQEVTDDLDRLLSEFLEQIDQFEEGPRPESGDLDALLSSLAEPGDEAVSVAEPEPVSIPGPGDTPAASEPEDDATLLADASGSFDREIAKTLDELEALERSRPPIALAPPPGASQWTSSAKDARADSEPEEELAAAPVTAPAKGPALTRDVSRQPETSLLASGSLAPKGSRRSLVILLLVIAILTLTAAILYFSGVLNPEAAAPENAAPRTQAAAASPAETTPAIRVAGTAPAARNPGTPPKSPQSTSPGTARSNARSTTMLARAAPPHPLPEQVRRAPATSSPPATQSTTLSKPAPTDSDSSPVSENAAAPPESPAATPQGSTATTAADSGTPSSPSPKLEGQRAGAADSPQLPLDRPPQAAPATPQAAPATPQPAPQAPAADSPPANEILGSAATRVAATPAVLLSKVLPSYPEFARRANLVGKVDLDIEIDRDGKVVKATPVSGPPVFHAAAVAAVRKWRFKPATINGNRVPSEGKVSVLFNKQR